MRTIKYTNQVSLYPGNELELIIRDWGIGIADVEQARAPLFTTGNEERSGMGFTIMESFMDSVKVRSHPGKGTTVTMRKRFAIRAGGSAHPPGPHPTDRPAGPGAGSVRAGPGHRAHPGGHRCG